MEIVAASIVKDFCTSLKVSADSAKEEARLLGTVESTVLHVFLEELSLMVQRLEDSVQHGAVPPEDLVHAELACARHEADDVKSENTFLRSALHAEDCRLQELLWRFSNREHLFAEVKSHALRQSTRAAAGFEDASHAAVPFELLESLDGETHRIRQWYEQKNHAATKALEVAIRKQRDGYEKRLEAKEKEIIQLQLRYRDSLSALQAAHSHEVTRLAEDRRDLRILLTDTEQLAVQRAEAFCSAKFDEKLRQVTHEFTSAMESLHREEEAAKEQKDGALQRLAAAEAVLSDTARHCALLQSALQHTLEIEMPQKVALASNLSASELESLRDANSGAHQRLVQVELELSAAREAFAAQKQHLEHEVAQLTSQLQTTRSEVQHKDSLLRDANSTKIQLNTQLQNLQKTEIQLQTELEFLRRASGGAASDAFKKLLEQVEADHDQRLVHLTEELSTCQEKLQSALDAKVDLSERLRLSEASYQSCDAERTEFRTKSNKFELRLQEMKEQYDSVQLKLREVQKSLVEERTNSIVGGSLYAQSRDNNTSSSGLLRSKSSRQLGSLAASRKSFNSGTFDDADRDAETPRGGHSASTLKRVASNLKRATSFRSTSSMPTASFRSSSSTKTQSPAAASNPSSHQDRERLLSPTNSDSRKASGQDPFAEVPRLAVSMASMRSDGFEAVFSGAFDAESSTQAFGPTLTVPGAHYNHHHGGLSATTDTLAVSALSAASATHSYSGDRSVEPSSHHQPAPTSQRRTSVRFSLEPSSVTSGGFLPPPGSQGSASSETAYVFPMTPAERSIGTADGRRDSMPETEAGGEGGDHMGSPGLEGADGTWQSLFIPAVELPVAPQRTGAMEVNSQQAAYLRTPNTTSNRSSFSGMIPFREVADAAVQTDPVTVTAQPPTIREVVRVREKIIHGAATPISVEDRRIQAQLRHELTSLHKEIGFLELQVRSLHENHPHLSRLPTPAHTTEALHENRTNLVEPPPSPGAGDSLEPGASEPFWRSCTKSCEAKLLELEPIPFTDISHKKEVYELNVAMGQELARRRDLMKRLQDQLQMDLHALSTLEPPLEVTRTMTPMNLATSAMLHPVHSVTAAAQRMRETSPCVEHRQQVVFALSSAALPPSRTVFVESDSGHKGQRRAVVNSGQAISPRLPSPVAMLAKLQLRDEDEPHGSQQRSTAMRSAGGAHNGAATMQAHPPAAFPKRPQSARVQTSNKQNWSSSDSLMHNLRSKIHEQLEPQTYFCVGHGDRERGGKDRWSHDDQQDSPRKQRPATAAVAKAPRWSSAMITGYNVAEAAPDAAMAQAPTMRVVSSLS